MSYFRESYEYPPLKVFLNSGSADIINNRGDITFNLNRTITLPNGVIGYISLNELTIPNTNYNITSSNNTLVLLDDSEVETTLTVTPGNYSVNDLMTQMNASMGQFATSCSYVSSTYNDITNMYKFTHSNSRFMTMKSSSTMLNVLGFESNTSYTSTPVSQTMSVIKTPNTVTGSITIITNTNDKLHFTSTVPFTNTVTLTAGTYTCANLATHITTLLQTAGNMASDTNIHCDYNSTAHRFVFSNITTATTFHVLDILYSVLPSMGFDVGTDYVSTPCGTSCYINSAKIVDLSGNNGFYLCTNLGVGNYSFLSTAANANTNVLSKIQFTCDSTGIEFYNNPTNFKMRFYDTSISKLHIRLYDEDFNPWIPAMDWSCVLELTFYEKYDLSTKLKTEHLLFTNK